MGNNNINLNQLSVAIALYEKRSVTGAAKMVGMSQPAVSNVLAKLRKRFNDELFLKTAHGMVPTVRARTLVESARNVLMQLNQEVFAQTAFDPATETSVTLATGEPTELIGFPEIFQALTNLAPDVVIRSVSPPPEELAHGIESGNIDLAIGKFPELEKKGFGREKLFAVDMTCVMRMGHPMAVKANALTAQQYRELRHLELNPGGRLGRGRDRLLRGTDVKHKLAASLTHMAGVANILAISDAVATVSRFEALYFCKINKNLKIVDAPFRRQFVFSMHWHRGLESQAKIQWLRDVIRKVYEANPELRGILHPQPRAISSTPSPVPRIAGN